MERTDTEPVLNSLKDIRDREDQNSWWLQGSPAHALLSQEVPEGLPSKLGPAAQLFLDSKDLPVFGLTLKSARGTCSHLRSAQSHLARSVMKVSSLPLERWDAMMLQSLDWASLHDCRLINRTDPVHTGQEAVAGLLSRSLDNPLRAGYCEIIPNHLDACTSCELLPSFSVILVKGSSKGSTG